MRMKVRRAQLLRRPQMRWVGGRWDTWRRLRIESGSVGHGQGTCVQPELVLRRWKALRKRASTKSPRITASAEVDESSAVGSLQCSLHLLQTLPDVTTCTGAFLTLHTDVIVHSMKFLSS
jgi:hypothetical protein